MSIKEKQAELVEQMGFFDSWTERYEYVISLGKGLALFPEEMRKEVYLIEGCQSQVWLYGELKEGKMVYLADSDSLITKGMIALFIQVFNGESPESIIQASFDFIDKIGLTEHLAPTRANALERMAHKMKQYALQALHT